VRESTRPADCFFFVSKRTGRQRDFECVVFFFLFGLNNRCWWAVAGGRWQVAGGRWQVAVSNFKHFFKS